VAFQKLLKKYKKWTGSSKLGRRFQRDVLGRPSSFSPDNFELLLAEWTDVLAAVRAPFKAGVTWKTGTDDRRGSAALIPATSECRVSTDAGRAEDECRKPSQVSSSVTELHDTTEGGTCLDLDTALATLPLGRAAGTASYWVHPDNIVELHVLLLQYTRLRNERIYSSNSSIPTSSRQSRRTSVNGQGSSPSGGTEDDVGHVVLDDLENFGKGQSGATASDVENDVGRRSEKAAASIRYCAGGGAVIVATTSPESSKPGSRSKSRVQKAKLKRKHLPSLFDPDLTPPSSHRSIDELTHSTTNQKSNPAQDLENMRRWLARHQEVQPLVELQYKRTRFVGLGNNTTRGLWATLDKDVTMRKASVRQLGGFEGLPTLSEGDGELTGVDRFPYALLDIRWGGDSGANLVRALDQSHLVSYAEVECNNS